MVIMVIDVATMDLLPALPDDLVGRNLSTLGSSSCSLCDSVQVACRASDVDGVAVGVLRPAGRPADALADADTPVLPPTLEVALEPSIDLVNGICTRCLHDWGVDMDLASPDGELVLLGLGRPYFAEPETVKPCRQALCAFLQRQDGTEVVVLRDLRHPVALARVLA